jgi:hypothetical protein
MSCFKKLSAGEVLGNVGAIYACAFTQTARL